MFVNYKKYRLQKIREKEKKQKGINIKQPTDDKTPYLFNHNNDAMNIPPAACNKEDIQDTPLLLFFRAFFFSRVLS